MKEQTWELSSFPCFLPRKRRWCWQTVDHPWSIRKASKSETVFWKVIVSGISTFKLYTTSSSALKISHVRQRPARFGMRSIRLATTMRLFRRRFFCTSDFVKSTSVSSIICHGNIFFWKDICFSSSLSLFSPGCSVVSSLNSSVGSARLNLISLSGLLNGRPLIGSEFTLAKTRWWMTYQSFFLPTRFT